MTGATVSIYIANVRRQYAEGLSSPNSKSQQSLLPSVAVCYVKECPIQLQSFLMPCTMVSLERNMLHLPDIKFHPPSAMV